MLYHSSQQAIMPPKVTPMWGIWAKSWFGPTLVRIPNHIDQFIWFCRAHQHTDTQKHKTDRQTSVALCCILCYACNAA